MRVNKNRTLKKAKMFVKLSKSEEEQKKEKVLSEKAKSAFAVNIKVL